MELRYMWKNHIPCLFIIKSVCSMTKTLKLKVFGTDIVFFWDRTFKIVCQ